MALNVALPLSGLLPELLYERCALLSPIQQHFEDNLELLVTPYDSSESGIGSSNDDKNPKSSSSSEDDDTPSTSSASSTSSSISPTPEKSKPSSPTLTEKPMVAKVDYQGRDVLDLAKNLTDNSWKFQYARLPNNNVSMFMQNRSQYHRLGADGLNCEYDLATCGHCAFQFPVMFAEDDAKRMRSTAKAQNNMPSYKMYKHF